eukprot:2681695-Rhodomonas_salina.1
MEPFRKQWRACRSGLSPGVCALLDESPFYPQQTARCRFWNCQRSLEPSASGPAFILKRRVIKSKPSTHGHKLCFACVGKLCFTTCIERASVAFQFWDARLTTSSCDSFLEADELERCSTPMESGCSDVDEMDFLVSPVLR